MPTHHIQQPDDFRYFSRVTLLGVIDIPTELDVLEDVGFLREFSTV
jgi:hypothetical protein